MFQNPATCSRLSNIWEEIPGKRHIYCNSLQSGQSDYMTAGFIATFVPVISPTPTTESPTPTEGLSTGQIVGIAIGSVFGVLLLLLLLIVLILLW